MRPIMWWRKTWAARVELSLAEIMLQPVRDKEGWCLLADGALVHIDDLGQLNRLHGPAVIASDGTQEWWRMGFRHRTDGPAILAPNGLGQVWAWGEFGGFWSEYALPMSDAFELWTSEQVTLAGWMEDGVGLPYEELRVGLDTSFALVLDALDAQAWRFSSRASRGEEVPAQWEETLRELRERHSLRYAHLSDELAEMEAQAPSPSPLDWRADTPDED